MDSATPRLAMFAPRQLARQVDWRTCLAVLLLCFVLSTEVLFAPSTLEGWTAGELADGWLEQFIDYVCLGMVTMAMVKGADSLIGENVRWRLLALLAVVVVATGGAYLGLTSLHFPAGYYPPTMVLVGEALRVIFLAMMVTMVWVVQRSIAQAARRLQLLEFHRVALKQGMLEAEMKVLEAQIEPHFLLNTLATVRCLFKSGTGSAEHMLANLKLYLGAALPQCRGEHPTLGIECALVGAYLNILQIRMGPRLAFVIDLSAELKALAFPPMALMTLVENAIKHGLSPLAEGGRVDIVARLKGAMLEVSVRDNGIGFRDSVGSGIGLVNIRSRLAVLYGRRARLELESNLPSGVMARIVLPADGLGQVDH
ncbi:MAG: histidine kinase [Pseudomonadota bacterium]